MNKQLRQATALRTKAHIHYVHLGLMVGHMVHNVLESRLKSIMMMWVEVQRELHTWRLADDPLDLILPNDYARYRNTVSPPFGFVVERFFIDDTTREMGVYKFGANDRLSFRVCVAETEAGVDNSDMHVCQLLVAEPLQCRPCLENVGRSRDGAVIAG